MRCNSPIQIIHALSGYPIEVRCGQCLPCRIRKQKVWAFRNLLEFHQHSHSAFVTLTYRDGERPENIDYSHFSKFLKRLRKKHTGTRIRYFACGEYGTKSGHAHFHALIYGIPFQERGLCHIAQWPCGFAYIGTVTPQSINYTARYLLKGGPRGDEFLTGMSLKPGIGENGLLMLGHSMALHKMPWNKNTPSLQHGDGYYPLDSYCRNKIAEGVREAGGLVQHDYTPLQSGLHAHQAFKLELLTGDPVARATQVRRSFALWSERQRMENSREQI